MSEKKNLKRFLFFILLSVAVVFSAQVLYAADMPPKIISIAFSQSATNLDPHNTNADSIICAIDAIYVTRISHIVREEAAPATALCSLNLNYYADWGVTGINYFRDGGILVKNVDYDSSLVPQK